MSYLVLARKYRPRTFAEVMGQEHVVRALTNALTDQRLHHAYMFTGTRGIGKTTIARILAKALNCTGPDGQGGVTAEPCGVCPSCRAIDAGNFVDYTELDAASNRGVDEVQGLLEQAVYKPVQGRFKVFMIDEVHMLSNTAFNAMLKTLEEPPEYLKFVLATTDPQKVPITVLSRCLQFNLRPMTPETVVEQLGSILGREQIEAEPQALRLLARGAHGSMRDALSLTDQAIAYGGGALREAAVREMLGSVSRDVVFDAIAALAAGDGARVVALVEQLRTSGQSAAAVLEDMANVLQRMAVAQAAPGAPVDPADPDVERIVRLARELAPDETQLLYSFCIHGRAELGLAPDEYVGLTMTLLRLLPFKAADGAAAPESSPTRGAAEKKTTAPARPGTPDPDPYAAAAVPTPAPPIAPASAAPPVRPEPLAPAAESGAEPMAPQPPARATQAAPVLAPVPVLEAGDAAAVKPAARDAQPAARAPNRAPNIPAPAVDETRLTVPTVPADARGLADFWNGLVKQLVADKAVTALARQLALQAQLVARDDQCWTLRVDSAALARDDVRDRLGDALAQAGHAVRLVVEQGAASDTPAQRGEARARQELEAATALIMDDPFVREMMHKHGAKVVPGSIRVLQ